MVPSGFNENKKNTVSEWTLFSVVTFVLWNMLCRLFAESVTVCKSAHGTEGTVSLL